MKIQDFIFLAIFVFVAWRRKPTLAARLGIFCLVLAIPLFKLWVLFTAERLTWYAATFFAYAVFFGIIRTKK